MCLFFLVVCHVEIEVPSLLVLLQLALRRLQGPESLFRGTQRGPLPGCTSAKLGTPLGCGVFLVECRLGGRENRVPSLLDLLPRAYQGPTEGLPGIWVERS